MSFRAAEATARPKAVGDARLLLDLISKTANAWPTIKPWLNETDIKGLTDQVSQSARGQCLKSPSFALLSPHGPVEGWQPNSRVHCHCIVLLQALKTLAHPKECFKGSLSRKRIYVWCGACMLAAGCLRGAANAGGSIREVAGRGAGEAG